MSDESKKEQPERTKPMSFMSMVVITGLFGGVFWSSIGLLAHYFSFTTIHPRVILEPWAIGDWKDGWLGTLISLGIIGLISIGVAFLYYILLRKLKSIWVGAAFGLALFALVLFVLNPIFPGIEPLRDLGRNTLITSGCLYLLYGVFIGFSISYEETEQKLQRKKTKHAAT